MTKKNKIKKIFLIKLIAKILIIDNVYKSMKRTGLIILTENYYFG